MAYYRVSQAFDNGVVLSNTIDAAALEPDTLAELLDNGWIVEYTYNSHVSLTDENTNDKDRIKAIFDAIVACKSEQDHVENGKRGLLLTFNDGRTLFVQWAERFND